MGNKIECEINKIDIPEELSQRSILGISEAKKEMNKNRKVFNIKSISVVAAVLFLAVSILTLNNNEFMPKKSNNKKPTLVSTNKSGIKIPAIQLSKNTANADMLGLIVYNGEIYTQTRTTIDPKDARALLGKKLGTTTGSIDEWSKQSAYDEQLASTVGKADVYTVKGYDGNFRIMTFGVRKGRSYANFYEHLNGITIHSGKDVFGKLKMVGNVSKAHYRTASDWDNNIQSYHSITDMKTVNDFVEELNKTKPFLREEKSDPITSPKTNENFRELTITLNDGSKVKLLLLKGGYIYYGYMGAYFKMDNRVFSKMWRQIQ